MEKGLSNSPPPGKNPISPWLIIMLTAPIPLLLFVFFFVKWYNQKTDFSKITAQFIQRQNTILAYDAMAISSGVSDLVEKLGRDVDILSVLPPTVENFQHFYAAQKGDITQFDGRNLVTRQGLLPFYNKIMFVTPKGDVTVYLRNGEIDRHIKRVSDCHPLPDLCDDQLLARAPLLGIGEIEFGGLMRWYAPQTEPEDPTDASIGVALRTMRGTYVLGLDYRHMKDYLTIPTFPYQPKKDLVQAYKNGNYVYIVDRDDNVLVHPKYWDVIGRDRKTGLPVSPIKTDADIGTHPLNIKAYEGVRAKDYFNRLLTKSFPQSGVDIFSAKSLGGIPRVLSVAPVLFSRGQFKQNGFFGHVIIGCNVDYFEEPKERYVPYN